MRGPQAQRQRRQSLRKKGGASQLRARLVHRDATRANVIKIKHVTVTAKDAATEGYRPTSACTTTYRRTRSEVRREGDQRFERRSRQATRESYRRTCAYNPGRYLHRISGKRFVRLPRRWAYRFTRRDASRTSGRQKYVSAKKKDWLTITGQCTLTAGSASASEIVRSALHRSQKRAMNSRQPELRQIIGSRRF